MPQVDGAPIHIEAGNRKIYSNIDQDFIYISTDRVRIIFEEYRKIIKRKIEWATPVGGIVSVLASIMTADFNIETFVVAPTIWEIIYSLILIGLLIWLGVYVYNGIKYRKKGTVEQFIEELKGKKDIITTPAQESPLVLPTNNPKIRKTKKKR
jgi:hypothetical protein